MLYEKTEKRKGRIIGPVIVIAFTYVVSKKPKSNNIEVWQHNFYGKQTVILNELPKG